MAKKASLIMQQALNYNGEYFDGGFMSAAEEKPVGDMPDLACLANVVDAVLVTVRDKEEQVRLHWLPCCRAVIY